MGGGLQFFISCKTKISFWQIFSVISRVTFKWNAILIVFGSTSKICRETLSAEFFVVCKKKKKGSDSTMPLRYHNHSIILIKKYTFSSLSTNFSAVITWSSTVAYKRLVSIVDSSTIRTLPPCFLITMEGNKFEDIVISKVDEILLWVLWTARTLGIWDWCLSG